MTKNISIQCILKITQLNKKSNYSAYSKSINWYRLWNSR